MPGRAVLLNGNVTDDVTESGRSSGGARTRRLDVTGATGPGFPESLFTRSLQAGVSTITMRCGR